MYKILGYLGIILVVVVIYFAFTPLKSTNAFMFEGYDELAKQIDTNNSNRKNEPKVLEEDVDVNLKEKHEEAKNEIIENKVDTMQFNRQIEDIIKTFMYELKTFNYNEINKYLSTPKFTSLDTSLIDVLKYNEEYNFFKNYIISYKTSVSDIEKVDETKTSAILKIERYDINKLHKKLLEEQYKNIEEYENATYEEILFQNEKYFNEEFVRSDVPMKYDSYKVNLVLEDNIWKIVNDDTLTDMIIDMNFRIRKEK